MPDSHSPNCLKIHQANYKTVEIISYTATVTDITLTSGGRWSFPCGGMESRSGRVGSGRVGSGQVRSTGCNARLLVPCDDLFMALMSPQGATGTSPTPPLFIQPICFMVIGGDVIL